ncbi:hypothetical protein PanWU01x14_272090 [Parasponia andersonii]|uniref:Uncharacterized protein n=1 Tax=Parasponia andersonii TaxID=3476 RepID=A0A2P5B4H8_PARAD|nr:hypothetical protein PanWU01x14_272090 [Parasponia andersonii]
MSHVERRRCEERAINPRPNPMFSMPNAVVLPYCPQDLPSLSPIQLAPTLWGGTYRSSAKERRPNGGRNMKPYRLILCFVGIL